jgi:phage recombination protein Bet
MNAVVKEEPRLPEPVARRGISEAAWRTAMNSLYPGARAESVLMVFDYCTARKLDPLKKPCHIVPMQVRTHEGDYVWRDVVMPGIYEYRTTATRTGLYLGHSEPEYGPEIDYLGVKAPAFCKIVVYRWNQEAKARAEYPVRVKFVEIAATAKDKKTGDLYVNARWTKAPEQMLTKCTEAAGLREAFPDELGGTHTVEEMEGQQVIDVTPATSRIDPRGDTSQVDWEARDKHFSTVVDILNADKEEHEIADMLRDYTSTYLNAFPELYSVVLDKLAADKIITKAKFREYLKVQRPEDLNGTLVS